MRYLVSTLLFLVSAGIVCLTPAAEAQNPPEDLTDLSLEQLMSLDVIPIDVLGTHIHDGGEWMLGYTFSHARMDAHTEEHGHGPGYMMQPEAMKMEMHVVKMMYGISDRFTVMTAIPFQLNEMRSHVNGGASVSRQTAGTGDVKVMGHYAIYRNRADYLIAKLGTSLPTGSIDESRKMPDGTMRRLPYPMQPGAGTYGIVGELTYIDQRYNWAWGAHARLDRWVGHNKRSYRPGSEYHLGAWITRRVTGWMAPLVHLDLHRSQDVVGADSGMGISMTPAADPERQGALHVVVEPGMSFYVPEGAFANHRLALEAPIVVYEAHDGAVMAHDWQLALTWQWAF